MMEEEIKKLITELGGDVCGIAGIKRFEDAPEGFQPRDIFPKCNSVIVFGVALPQGVLQSQARLVYSHFNSLICSKVDEITLNAAKKIEEKYGKITTPVPCDGPYEYWDAENLEGKGLLSMKHAAYLAGLGTIGKSTMLINETYGNRLTIGCILTELELKSDELAEELCLKSCKICIENCPVNAISIDGSVNQKKCRENSFGKTKRGLDVVNCNLCRKNCPIN